jgi:hypothetical protein
MGKSLLITAVLLCFALPLMGQRTVQRDGAAVAVLDEAFASRKAAAALIRNSVAEGQIRLANGQNGTIRITTQGPHRLRYEIALRDRRLTSVIKDGTGFRLIGPNKKDFPLWITAYASIEHIPMLSRILDYQNQDIRIVDLGLQTFAGRQCHQVRLSVQPEDEKIARTEDLISELHVFIDAQTKQVVGTRGFIFSPEAIENRSPVDRVFSDYRLIDGVLIPFRIEQYVSGKPDQVLTWTSVQLNVGIADDLFD